MKYLLGLLVFLLVSPVLVCCGGVQRTVPQSAEMLVREISTETVALIATDSDGDVAPFCSGVWVGPELILTAGHCARAMAEDEGPVLGVTIAYIVQNEVNGYYQAPKRYHAASVLKVDEDHDLALLSAPSAPPHNFARMVTSTPSPGEGLHFIGQDRGFYWTYMRGVVSGTWSELRGMKKLGPWLQVTAPVSGGMSGSGAFDESGRLVGICSSVASAPSVAFYVHPDTLRRFLDRS